MLGESQTIARNFLTELTRPQMGLATFKRSFGRQLYCEADSPMTWAGVGLAGFLSSGHLKRQSFPLGHFRKAGWVGEADLRTLLSGSGAFDWGWSHLGCCLSRTGLESLELLSSWTVWDATLMGCSFT